MKILDFNPEDKSNWGDLQAEISSLIVKALKMLPNGFLIALARRDSDEGKKILGMEKKPSNNQRGYYWDIVIPTIRRAAAEQGQHFKNDEELHSNLKQLMMENYSLYEEKVNLFTGKVYKEGFSVSNEKGNKANTAKFIDTVINWAAEFYGVQIPEASKS